MTFFDLVLINNDITFNFEEITKAAASAVPPGTTLDGELVVCDIETGKPDFEAVMSRFQSKPKLGRTPGLAFVSFDIIRHQGNDLRSLDLMSRKAILEEALIENEVIKLIRFKEVVVNPFEVDDIVVRTAIGGNTIIKAFQVVKKSVKSVTIKQIFIENNIPQINNFKIGVPERRAVKQDSNNNFVVNHDDWYLYKYNSVV